MSETSNIPKGFKGQDLTGKRFGRCVVVRYSRMGTCFHRWWCLCDCGKLVEKSSPEAKKGRSCGCYKFTCKKTHGLSRLNGETRPMRRIWHGMKRRCTDPKTKYFEHYGGRGIKLSKDWMTYPGFIADMAESWYPGATIERKDVNGNYCKENCCWIPRSKQASNRRDTRRITFKGESLMVGEWSERIGAGRSTIFYRLEKGWPLERALLTPPAIVGAKIKTQEVAA